MIKLAFVEYRNQSNFFQLLGVFFIKASGYKMVEENSKYNDSFWYSVEHKTRKSAYHLLFMSNKPELIEDPGKRFFQRCNQIKIKSLQYLFIVFLVVKIDN
jgi:hypothetical protein